MASFQAHGVKKIFIEHLTAEETELLCEDCFSSNEMEIPEELYPRLFYHDFYHYQLIEKYYIVVADELQGKFVNKTLPKEMQEKLQNLTSEERDLEFHSLAVKEMDKLIENYKINKLTNEQKAKFQEMTALEEKEKYNLVQLFLTAKRNGIKIFPTDTVQANNFASYEERTLKFNEFSEKFVKDRLLVNEKYLFVCGKAHAGKYRSVKGMDERFNIPKIYVVDPLSLGLGINSQQVLVKDAISPVHDQTTTFDYVLILSPKNL